MKLVPILLLAEAALGAHLTQQRRETHAKRIAQQEQEQGQGRLRMSRPKQVNGVTDIIETEYSDNWAGGVITSTDVTSVNGTIVVPSVTAPADGTASKYWYVNNSLCVYFVRRIQARVRMDYVLCRMPLGRTGQGAYHYGLRSKWPVIELVRITIRTGFI